MKKFLGRGFLLVLLASIGLPFLPAQDTAPKAQLFFVLEEVVKPEASAKWVEAVKEEWTQAAKFNIAFGPVVAWSSDDYHYYFRIPIENFGSLDVLMKSWIAFHQELKKNWGNEAYNAWAKKIDGTREYYRRYVFAFRPDVSYLAANPRLKPEEGKFIEMTYFYVLDGKEQEADNIAKEFVALYKSKDVNDSFENCEGLFGFEQPVYFVVSRGKDAADYYGDTSAWDKLGKDGQETFMKLVEKLRGVTRKTETKTLYFRPDLSYIPKR